MFRVMGRIGAIDPDALDPSVEIFESWDDLLRSHADALADGKPASLARRRPLV